MKTLLTLALLILTGASDAAEFASPPTIDGLSGTCTCKAEGKTWPCRQVIDYSQATTCNLTMILSLVCPDDKALPCSYVASSGGCSQPSTFLACIAEDRPQ